MAWGKAGSISAGTAVTNQTVTGLGSNKFIMGFSHIVSGVGNSQAELQFGHDTITTTGYSFRKSDSSGAAVPSGSTSVFKMHNTSANEDKLFVFHMVNLPTKEKLTMGWIVESGGVNASDQPARAFSVGKFAYTADEINQIKNQSSNLQRGTNFSVLGSDADLYVVQDGAVFYEKDTNKEYILNNGVWSKL